MYTIKIYENSPESKKRFTAKIYENNNLIKTTNFGQPKYYNNKRTITYYDYKNLKNTPKKLNLYMEKKRINYRKRHKEIYTKNNERAIDKLFSPAWFSYHFLW